MQFLILPRRTTETAELNQFQFLREGKHHEPFEIKTINTFDFFDKFGKLSILNNEIVFILSTKFKLKLKLKLFALICNSLEKK